MTTDGSPFSAADSALGYLFQCRYALLDSLRRWRQGEDFLITVETLDDIVFERKGQPAELLQTKHHLNRQATLTDSNHAGSKGIQFDLGNALNPPGSDILLAGPSDAGLYDPGTCTAVSLLLITTNLILYRNEKLTALIVVESLNLLTDEILESFADAEAELAAKVDVIRHGEDTAPPTRV
jgi:hypothetical protein